MILLDTNVVSAIMRAEQEPSVIGWLDRQKATDLFVSSPTLFEIQFGIAKAPAGRNRRDIEARFHEVLATLFAGRVLDFCQPEALGAGTVHWMHIAAGRNVKVPDSQIAGIARHVGAAVATRNLKDFEGIGVHLINPWNAGS